MVNIKFYRMIGPTNWLKTCFFVIVLLGFVQQKSYGQDAFMGYETIKPWTTGTTTFNDINYTLVGSKTSTKVCGTTDNVDVFTLSSNNTDYLEIDIPNNATKEYIVNILASGNGSSAGTPALVYSDKSPFDESSVISAADITPSFTDPKNICVLLTITPPSNAKSLRLYRRIDYYSSDHVVFPVKTSSSGRTQVGNGQTIRFASVVVWATATPTQQVQNITFSNVSTSAMDVSFTRGNGSKIAVFAKEGIGATTTNPVANTAYTANADWKSGAPTGTQLGTSGYYNVYNGIGNTFSLKNLKPATQYTLQAFEYTVTPTELKYLTTTATGNPSSQTTKALSKPTVTTNPITNILSNKATCGGVIPDSGGVAITEKGLVWGTTPNPTTTVNLGKLPLGTTASSFSDFIKNLTPLTKYYVVAYATNALGTTLGNQQEFTTAAPAPVLITNPGSIDFGENYYNTSPFTISYTLTGSNLSPASGNITITAPSGFLISKSGNTGFATTLTIQYTGGKISGLPIYAQLPVTSYGTFSGNITHSGGGTSTVDADIVKLSGSIIQSEEELSNRGTDFWTGFGYIHSMEDDKTDADSVDLSIYVATGDQAAEVTVSTPKGNAGYSKTQMIPPNSVYEFTNFPIGSGVNSLNEPDTRLFQTGKSDKGIHITSNNGTPISVWMHTYTKGNTAAGSMLFPTNTWNSSYTVLSSGGKVNNGYKGNSYFFVIANEDNTEIEFTPSNPIINAASVFTDNHGPNNILYQKNQTYKETLNKGQIFNAIGYIDGSTDDSKAGLGALDLTGTIIKTTCDKKIAVFSGNGRLGMALPTCGQGSGTTSDHLIQQMLPTAAWGTKYLTSPTKTMERNKFRVVVNDVTTKVYLNHTLLPSSNLVNGLYYEFSEATPTQIIPIPLLIESDKPVSVTQFVIDGQCSSTANYSGGKGDPEMIILSPIQQAINKVTVFSAPIKSRNATASAQGHYINIIMKKEGIASFKIDNKSGTALVDVGVASNLSAPAVYGSKMVALDQAFTVHPQDNSYVYGRFKVAPAISHTISSDYPFNAIAYGMSNPNSGESYGYNAGTAIKNLTSLKIAVNPSGVDTSSTSVKTGKNNPVTLKIALPHNPNLVDYITWNPGTDPRISPNGASTGAIDSGTGKAKYDGTIDIDGRTFYIYSSPVQYQFSEDGIYKVTATATGTFVSECGGQDAQKITVQVGRDNINIDFNTTCGNPAINFVNNTTAMQGTTITKWEWDFGDNTTSTLKDPPPHTYNTANGYKYTVKLTTTNSVGVITTGNLEVDFSGGLDTKFTASAKDVCAGTKITFDPSPTTITGTTSGDPVSWTWDFGEGTPVVINSATTPPAQDHTYLTAGKFAVKLTLKTTNNCENTFIDTVLVGSAPKPLIEAPLISCFGDEIEYLDKSTIDFGKIKTWAWTFDDNTTSADQNPKHKWLTSGPHKTTLTVTSEAGCPAINAVEYTVNVLPLPTAAFTVSAPLCVGTKVVFTDASSPNTTSSTISEWVWDFGDGSAKVTKTVSEPTEHTFTTAGPFDVTLTVKNAAGCLGAVLKKTIIINAIPEPSFTVTAVCVPTGSAQFTASNAGTATINSWLWDFGDAGTSNVKNPLHIYAAGGKYTVKLTATSATGCPVAITNDVEVFDAPTPDFSVENKANLCSDAEVKITDLSKVNGYGSISKIELYWDYLNQPAVKSTFDFPTINTVYQNLYPNPTTAASKTYRVLIRAYTNPTCFKETYQDITVNAMPEAVLNPFAAVCQEKPSFDLTGGRDTRNLAGTGVYSGDGITTSPVFSPALAGPGTHLIRYTYTTTAGCTSIAEQEIVVNETPVVDLGNKTIYVKDKESKVLNPTIIKGANLKYTWSPSTYLSSATIENPSCRPLDDITYTLTVETPEGCKSTATVVVNLLRELLPPNTFTPNGDNYNDVWEIKYFDTYPNASVSVFNRYGKKVFEAKSGSAAWDGKFNGTDLPVGTYYYIVDPKDGSKTITGSVTIIR